MGRDIHTDSLIDLESTARNVISTRLRMVTDQDINLGEDEDHAAVNMEGKLIIDLTADECTNHHLGTSQNYSNDESSECRSMISAAESSECKKRTDQKPKKRTLSDMKKSISKLSKKNSSRKDLRPSLMTNESVVTVEEKDEKNCSTEDLMLDVSVNIDANGSQNPGNLDDNDSAAEDLSVSIHESDSDEENDDLDTSGSGSDHQEDEADDVDEGSVANKADQTGETVDEDKSDKDDEEGEDEGGDGEGEEDTDQSSENEDDKEMAVDETDDTLGEKEKPSASNRRSSRPPRPSMLALQFLGDLDPHISVPSR